MLICTVYTNYKAVVHCKMMVLFIICMCFRCIKNIAVQSELFGTEEFSI